MDYNLLPTDLIQQTSDASTEQARQLLSQASSMAGSYLQNLKAMAGGSADQPMKTMQKDQMDQDNALKKTNEYMAVSGNVPGADFLRSVGLSDTLGPLAGTKTLDAKNADNDLAMKWYNATKVSSGSGVNKPSGSGVNKPSDNEEKAAKLADSYKAIDNLLATGTDPAEIQKIINDSEADLTRYGLTVEQPILYLNNKVALASGGTRSTGDPVKDMQVANATKAAADQKEKARLDSRPWWEKAIDTVVPGAQYR
jgi:ElaB/YqjD/DUF883 family membrane-anchored ribosome-binding protein